MSSANNSACAGVQPLLRGSEEGGGLLLRYRRASDACNACTGETLTIVSENVQGRRHRTMGPSGKWRQPFLRSELDELVRVGYREVGWREVSTADFGVPNPKKHIVLVAHSGLGSIVGHCLFSTVRWLHLPVFPVWSVCISLTVQAPSRWALGGSIPPVATDSQHCTRTEHTHVHRGTKATVSLCHNTLCVCVQGVTGCADCGSCASCTGGISVNDAGAAVAWDLGEIYGLAEPCKLPAPTTTSLARTVVCYAHSRTWAQLDIRDAERAQGLQPDHTWLPEDSQARSGLTAAQLRATRFRCVGNALHGGVRQFFHLVDCDSVSYFPSP